jgi:hypothetical protein
LRLVYSLSVQPMSISGWHQVRWIMTSRLALNLFVVMTVLLLGGCPGDNSSNNNAGGDSGVDSDPPLATSSCTNNTQPCASVSQSGLIASCLLQTTNCGVDLDDVVSQVGNQVTQDTVMWIQAWGGKGGNTDKGTSGGAGGYAQTTTTVNDIKSMFDGSAQLYYFLAGAGADGGDHCGSAGGSATNVTFEDLTQSPSNPPSLASPPTYLVAGGGGGGCGGNGEFLCFTPGCPADGGKGGIATAGLGINGEGTGGEYASGMGGQLGVGGASHCIECGGGNETSGLGGFGGRGGGGGSGQSCNGPGAPALFYNNTTANTQTWTAGAGGKGSSNTSDCDAGGGGGGGGWGGGGGGGHGNNNGSAIPGGGGGSYAIYSTQASSLAPSNSRPANPCKPNYQGCVQVQFVLTPPVAIEPVMLPGPNGPTDCTPTSQPWSVTAGDYLLTWQGDGNFVLYKNGQAVWATHNEQLNNQLCFQGDGNLVLYSASNGVLWATNTADTEHGGNGGRLLSLWTNGMLQITDPSGAPIWHEGPFD